MPPQEMVIGIFCSINTYGISNSISLGTAKVRPVTQKCCFTDIVRIFDHLIMMPL